MMSLKASVLRRIDSKSDFEFCLDGGSVRTTVPLLRLVSNMPRPQSDFMAVRRVLRLTDSSSAKILSGGSLSIIRHLPKLIISSSLRSVWSCLFISAT